MNQNPIALEHGCLGSSPDADADGRTVDMALCRAVLVEELAKLRASNRSGGYEVAAELFIELTEASAFPEFLTLPAYDMITAGEA